MTDDRSLVLITHRLAGLESVDEILVVDAGRVVERGTHDELIDQDGRYCPPVVGGDEDRALRAPRPPTAPTLHHRPPQPAATTPQGGPNDRRRRR